ncbi:MAG: spermidine/putrescine ABC transporter substrate-binding protein [Actinomycetota bacterium]|nr:spermidine/putrescine ABC transporter substrate-binding protein [Actinomycetota bacterium]
MSDLPDLSRINTRHDITRRELLRRAGIGAGAVSMSAFLAACGIGGGNEGGNQSEDDGLTTTEENGELNFANWPLYIDRAKGRRPTLDDFTKASGIQVNYKENIQDNESFFGTIQEPLANDQAIEWDIIVVTDWMIARMVRLGYLEELDHSLLSNFEANAGQIYKDPVYDPGNAHSIPWQSGITGIGYNPELTGGEITSFNQLFEPALKGKVGMFKEMRDTFTLTLLSMNIDPQEASIADVEAATDKLIEQREQGIVRQYYGNEYADALLRGDLAATMAWSGDVFQLQFDNPDLRFVVPDEGGVLWVDNMAIPQNAANPIDAHTFMNFVYGPEIAAQITGWVNYICPVPAAQDLLLEQGKKDSYYKTVAESPLVFPTPEMEANLHGYRDLTTDEEEQWQDLFQSVIQG